MKTVALYQRQADPQSQPYVLQLEEALTRQGVTVCSLGDGALPPNLDLVISIGGDGTLLGATHHIGGAGIPILGFNVGHLGFLTTAGRDDVQRVADDLVSDRFRVEERTLLDVCCSGSTTHAYALNEAYVQRGEQPTLLHTSLYVDEEYVATYPADGLIVATPTGSTAYSLGCGGPILTPTSGCFVITPIAAHTLTLRPIIVPDNARLRLTTASRQPRFSLGVDSQSQSLPVGTEIEVRRAPFTIKLVRLLDQSFFTAMREKLSWGK